MTTTILIEVIEHGPETPSHCPCGCGWRSTDKHATRWRLLDEWTDRNGTVHGPRVESHRSVDGGRTWFGATWHSGRDTERLIVEHGLDLALLAKRDAERAAEPEMADAETVIEARFGPDAPRRNVYED
jgi:hypothetical protein